MKNKATPTRRRGGQAWRSRWRLLVYGFLLPFLFLLGGCARRVPKTPPAAPAVGESRETPETIAESLRQAADLQACRQAVQQLNGHFGRHPKAKPPVLTEAEYNFLRQRFSLDEDELMEVGRTSFTLL